MCRQNDLFEPDCGIKLYNRPHKLLQFGTAIWLKIFSQVGLSSFFQKMMFYFITESMQNLEFLLNTQKTASLKSFFGLGHLGTGK